MQIPRKLLKEHLIAKIEYILIILKNTEIEEKDSIFLSKRVESLFKHTNKIIKNYKKKDLTDSNDK